MDKTKLVSLRNISYTSSVSHPCPGSELRHEMLGQKPVSLFALLPQHNHEIKFIATEVSSVFMREVRWTQVHAGYTQS